MLPTQACDVKSNTRKANLKSYIIDQLNSKMVKGMELEWYEKDRQRFKSHQSYNYVNLSEHEQTNNQKIPWVF